MKQINTVFKPTEFHYIDNKIFIKSKNVLLESRSNLTEKVDFTEQIIKYGSIAICSYLFIFLLQCVEAIL